VYCDRLLIIQQLASACAYTVTFVDVVDVVLSKGILNELTLEKKQINES